jgi:quercetin dioxygenase-like cupin family protein
MHPKDDARLKAGGRPKLRIVMLGVMVYCGCSPLLHAQGATKVDAKHYSVVSENAQVRILKVHYGAHEKSIMHSHPATVAVFLSDGKGRFTFPDGKSQDFVVKSGDAMYSAAATHLPENTGDQPLDLIVIELKGKSAEAAKAAAN